jgi:membrane-bound hydrogenase subunit beta
MTDQELQTKIAEHLGARGTVTVTHARRLLVVLPVDALKPTMKWLKDQYGFYHCSTVTGLDSGENLEVLYHITDGGPEVSFRISVPKSNPHIPTVTDIIPGALLYERELQDMFGFVVDDIPDPRRYVLPEDWPLGVYPLRKDYKVAQ